MEITSRIQTTIFIVDGLCGCLFTTTETLDKHVLSTTSSGAPSATTKKEPPWRPYGVFGCGCWRLDGSFWTLNLKGDRADGGAHYFGLRGAFVND